MLRLLLLVVPLGLDTFAVATALGLRGLPARERLRVSLVMSAFELAMPIVGVLVGRALGGPLGSTADYVAAALLALVGVYMLAVEDERREDARVGSLVGGHGLPLLLLGLGISLDELAIGFSIGLLGLSLWLAVLLIGAQAFLFAQLGVRLGARLGGAAPELAERAAAVALLGLAALLLGEKLL